MIASDTVGQLTYELTAITTAYQRAVQAQPRPNPSVEREVGHTVPP